MGEGGGWDDMYSYIAKKFGFSPSREDLPWHEWASERRKFLNDVEARIGEAEMWHLYNRR